MNAVLKPRPGSVTTDPIKTVTESGVYLLGNPSMSAFRRVSFNPLNGLLRVDVDNKSYNYTEEVSADNLTIEGRVLGKFERS